VLLIRICQGKNHRGGRRILTQRGAGLKGADVIASGTKRSVAMKKHQYLGRGRIATEPKRHREKEDFTLEKIDDMAGWFIQDACIFKEKIYYCSGQRILFKNKGKIQTTSIEGSADLISITTGLGSC
jgi:hypothetical protein